jgi:hypothetical protein
MTVLPPVGRLGPFTGLAATLNSNTFEMAKLVDGFKDGRPELGRRTFLVPENHAEVLALLYHEQTGIVGGLPVGPVTTDPFGSHGIRMYPDQDPIVLEETRRYFEKLAERFSNDLPKA